MIGDVCAPVELIVPIPSVSAQPTMSGALFLSGAKLYFSNGVVPVLVTSA